VTEPRTTTGHRRCRVCVEDGNRGARAQRRARDGDLAVFAVALAVVVVVVSGGCAPGSRGHRRLSRIPSGATSGARPAAAAPATTPATTTAVPIAREADDHDTLSVSHEDARLAFDVAAEAGGSPAAVVLGARVTRAHGVRGPGVVIVPGGGDVSRNGRRNGDGVVAYGAPVDVSRAWAEAFASRGAVVVSYDKRTCGANDDPLCTTNPQGDVDARGPVALAVDVDAACALLRRDPAFDGRLVLLAHGQAAQVALSSTCAQSAQAIVLLSPIPRAVDAVLVDALLERQQAAATEATRSVTAKAAATAEAARLKNLAASRAASFASMKSGKFSPDARVDGATIAFWLGWMKLTAETPTLLAPVGERVVTVVGGADRQLSSADRVAAAALPARHRVVVEDADHHLLLGGQLVPVATEPVFAAIDAVLGAPGS
jgi:hypothetical protein